MFQILKNYIYKYIQNSQYKKNILILVSGRIVSQVIPILLSPIVTRLYSPEEFGIFAVYSTIVSIAALISTGRYCLAIILPKDLEESKSLVFISSVFTLAFSLLLLVFLLAVGNIFFSLLNIEVLNDYVPFLVLNMVFMGLYESLFYYVLRTKEYKMFAINAVAQALILITSRLAFGYWGLNESGLIYSTLISYVFAYILLIFTLLRTNNFSLEIATKVDFKKLLYKYRKFPQYSLFADFLSMTTNLSPSIFLNKIFGSVSAGYFSLSEKVLGSPIWFVTSSVGDVFRQEAAEQYRERGTCIEIFKKTAKSMLLLGIVPFALIFVLVPPLVPFIFGEEWTPAGDYIRIFTLMYFAKFVVTPVSYVNYIIDRQRYNIYFQSLRFISIVFGFIIGFYTRNILIGLVAWSLLVTLSYLVIFLMSLKFAKSSKYVPED